MTAQVIPLLPQRYAPDAESVIDVLETLVEPDDSEFFALAQAALRGVQGHRGKPFTHSRARGVVNGIAIAFVSLGALLGVGDEAIALALANSPVPSDAET